MFKDINNAKYLQTQIEINIIVILEILESGGKKSKSLYL